MTFNDLFFYNIFLQYISKKMNNELNLNSYFKICNFKTFFIVTIIKYIGDKTIEIE